MPISENTEKVARKLLPIIYILDTSGSMAGACISSVNEAMHETVEVLKEVSDSNPTAELKIGVMQFDSNVRWVTNGLVYMEDYFWNDLEACGLTEFGAALNELEKKLSRKEFLSSDVGYKAPVLIFMTDGYPTDENNGVFDKALNKIKKNKWFQIAAKIGIGVGDDFSEDAIVKVVGNKEAVIKVTDTDSLKKLIRVVSVTASQIGSKSRADDDTMGDIIRETGKAMQGDSDVVIPDPVPVNVNPSPSSTDPGDVWGGGFDDGDW